MAIRARLPVPLRSLARDAASTLLAVVLLGLALGTAAAAFSILNAIVLAPFPFARQDQLALIWRTDPRAGVPVIEMSYRDAIDISTRSRTLASVASFGSINWDLPLLEPGPRTTLHVAGVSGTFFPTLNTQALLGRTLGPLDDTPSSSLTLVVSHALWTQRFGGDPQIIGRSVRANAHGGSPESAVIVGVMPRAFDFPRGADVWAPMMPLLGAKSEGIQNRRLAAFFWLGRLQAHATVQDAQRELTLLLPQLNPSAAPADPAGAAGAASAATAGTTGVAGAAGTASGAAAGTGGAASTADAIDVAGAGAAGAAAASAAGATDVAGVGAAGAAGAASAAGPRPVVTPLVSYLLGPSRTAVWTVFNLAILVWLLACSNVSGLLLVQWSRRRHEMALQRALGAGTGQIVLQWLLQAAALTAGAGLVAVVIAEAARRLLIALAGSTVPRLQDATMNAQVLIFGVLLSATAVLLSAAAPAWQAARVMPMDVLKQRAGRARSRTQTWVVGIELIVAIIALAMAGRLVRAMLDLDRLDFGFQPQGVLTMDLRPGGGDWNRFYDERFLPRARTLPGVAAAGAIFVRPLRYDAIGSDSGVIVEGQTPTERTFDANPGVNEETVTPGYFEAAGIPTLRGRAFDTNDRADSPAVVVVSERTARTLWPAKNPIGQRLLLQDEAQQRDAHGQLHWRTIIGVVKDVRYRGVTDVRFDVYVPATQSTAGVKHLFVRTTGDPLSLVEPIRRLAHEIDPAVQIQDVETLPHIVYEATRIWRLTQTIALTFGLLAIAIAGIGLYALLAQTVSARRYELAVRAALGARPLQLSRLVLRDTFLLASGAVAIGLIAAVPVTNRLAALDVSHSGVDLPALIGVVALLLIAALVASLRPAVRAAQTAPSAVLRHD